MVTNQVRAASIVGAVLASLALAVASACVTGCESYGPRHRDRVLTQAEHDSILATETAIPGTVVVARALDQKERNARRNAAFNAQIDSLTR
jgi:hypothetical protein